MLAHKLAVTLTPAWLHYTATCLRTVDTLTLDTSLLKWYITTHTDRNRGRDRERQVDLQYRQVIMPRCEMICHLNISARKQQGKRNFESCVSAEQY